MEGPVHTIAITYCPLKTIDEKLKNQQSFCINCPFHNECELKAKTCFEKLKEDYLKPYDSLLEWVNQFKKNTMEEAQNTLKSLKKYMGE